MVDSIEIGSLRYQIRFNGVCSKNSPNDFELFQEQISLQYQPLNLPYVQIALSDHDITIMPCEVHLNRLFHRKSRTIKGGVLKFVSLDVSKLGMDPKLSEVTLILR